MMNSILASLLVISLGTLSYGASKTALNRKALQNPGLYGGDMRGVDFNGFSKTRSTQAAEPTGAVLWPGGQVPYVIDDSLAEQADLIKSAMQEYHDKTCVRFVPRSDEQDYLKIQFDDSGCNSYIGVLGGEQPVNLGDGCHWKGTVMHELGHAVGFLHEHQRSDRDQFVSIIQENIGDGMENQFTKYNGPDNLLLVNFDYQSVMLYGPTSFSKDGQSVTIEPSEEHQGQQIQETWDKNNLSDLDVQAVNQLYKCGDNGANTGNSDGNNGGDNGDNTGDNGDNQEDNGGDYGEQGGDDYGEQGDDYYG